MWKPQKTFRYVWRINAILILIISGAIVLAVGFFLLEDRNQRVGRQREAATGIPLAGPIAGKESSAVLTLGRTTTVKGTNILRTNLLLQGNGGKEFASGGGDTSEIRNVLFIEPGEKSGRWLLPDNNHIISDTEIIDETNTSAERTLATSALVQPADAPDDTPGRLVLYNPSGKLIVEVANNVKKIHLASFSDGEITILYERNRRFVLAEFDPNSLARKKEQEIDVVQLK